MRLSYAIGTSGLDAPPHLPVKLTELRSGQVVGYYPNRDDAYEHLRLLERVYTDPDDDLDDPDDDDPDDGEDLADDLPPDMVEPDNPDDDVLPDEMDPDDGDD